MQSYKNKSSESAELKSNFGKEFSSPVYPKSSRSIPIELKKERKSPDSAYSPVFESTISDKKENWIKVGTLQVHPKLLEKGLLVTKTSDVGNVKVIPEENSFVLGSRTLKFFQPKPPKSGADSASLALDENKLNDHRAEGLDDRAHIKLLNKLNQFSATTATHSDLDTRNEQNTKKLQSIPTNIVVNTHRREEAFFPFLLNVEGKPARVYGYPWASKNTDQEFNFEGFKKFVSAGCMFGASLKGECGYGQSFPIIKHDLPLHPGQKVESVFYDAENNIYEKYFLSELKKHLAFIHKYSNPSAPKQLYLHLPILDYILFGVQIFIRDQITDEVQDSATESPLNALFRYILQKGEELAEKITALCKEHHVSVVIGSPFENLFAPIKAKLKTELEKGEEGQFSTVILEQLGIPKNQAVTETEVVHDWLEVLQKSQGDESHQRVWQDIMRATIKKQNGDKSISSLEDTSALLNTTIKDIDDLFKIGNGAWVLMSAGADSSHYETCVLEPLTEKPIQLTAAMLSKCPELAKKYPATINLTLIDSYITYSPHNLGLTFYHTRETLAHMKLLERWQTIAHQIELNSIPSSQIKKELSAPQPSHTSLRP